MRGRCGTAGVHGRGPGPRVNWLWFAGPRERAFSPPCPGSPHQSAHRPQSRGPMRLPGATTVATVALRLPARPCPRRGTRALRRALRGGKSGHESASRGDLRSRSRPASSQVRRHLGKSADLGRRALPRSSTPVRAGIRSWRVRFPSVSAQDRDQAQRFSPSAGEGLGTAPCRSCGRRRATHVPRRRCTTSGAWCNPCSRATSCHGGQAGRIDVAPIGCVLVAAAV